ncbi:CMP-N-acetlyneuraminic acid synthetase [Veronia nyctiphanis]|uniref:CMP-N-acetlyneuraminic acid synthetase n=1 Tax=Veronia nyctiphanis TaxID=1278244 RepID=A0A4Q0YUH9_9GAMM|nr:acylneuraminate cytidylyltransferase family protein [Veronia nyctiphanis]RXJ72809.1 CMP-N-acetlyneuraminic acid synthetase [Veronia nyctiphanis]
MLNGKVVMAVIPARGGSKRLPGKNILPLAGKPLIGWTIEAAQQSQYVDKVVVSTDSQQIADVADMFGVRVPSLRAPELSDDKASSVTVLIDAVERYGSEADIIVLLQPTSPLRTSEHIDNALTLFDSKEALSVISVTPCEHSPLWANTLPDTMAMDDFIRPEAAVRSQDLPTHYRLNGAIYALDKADLLQTSAINFSNRAFAFEMDSRDSVDIDTQLDLDLAEVCIRKYKGK